MKQVILEPHKRFHGCVSLCVERVFLKCHLDSFYSELLFGPQFSSCICFVSVSPCLLHCIMGIEINKRNSTVWYFTRKPLLEITPTCGTLAMFSSVTANFDL